MRGMEVVSLENKGNGVISSKPYAKGDFVLKCECWVSFLDDDDACFCCFEDSDPLGPALRKCKRCKVARYCSDYCMALDDQTHHCEVLKEIDEYDEDLKTAAVIWDEMHRGKRNKDFEKLFAKPLEEEDFSSVTQKINSFKFLPPIDDATVRCLIGRDLVNSFGIDVRMREGERNQDGEPDVNYLGRGVYPEASFFNHSCDPNVTRFRYKRSMIFFARKDIEKGQEMTICYSSRGEERRSFLKENYGFHCDCGKCHLDNVEKKCENCGCEIVNDMCLVCDAEKFWKFYTEKQDE